MKAQTFFRFVRPLVLLSVVVPAITAVAAPADQPVITAVRPERTNIVVEASVPAGLRKITLEGRSRLGAGAWEPRAVLRLDGTGGNVTFRLPRLRALELMRVRADASEPLPASFYSGASSFVGQPGGTDPTRATGGGLDTPGGGGIPPVADNTQSRDVVESDIWKISGDTLFFFNQYRGLQVIDIGQPDHAVVRGTLDLPAAGEQMYLRDARHVVLLARDGCGSGDESAALIVTVDNGTPRVTTKFAIKGWIQESRMVGTALYVASQTYRVIPNGTGAIWETGTLVSSFDLADPDAPVARDTLWYPGGGNVIAATDVYLFVVTQDATDWWKSIVNLVDITAPDGSLAAYASLHTAGRVPDKFKLNYAGGVLTTISEDWRGNTGMRVITKLENFHVPDPRSLGPAGILKLGELSLGGGEQLHATRFDGNKVYVVTFFRVDPLWVVDLSDAAHPRIAGELQVPGWSTYLQPLGDRLAAVGVEGSRVAVSLFDVHDAAHPALLSKVLLGRNYSWTEANYDEKAFSVLPDAGLILVPYNGDTTNGWTSTVQFIDLNDASLVARGRIEHQFQPRRATFSHDRVLSLSGHELLSVDATDRDHPLVRGTTELAWSVDRLFVQGDYLIELATGSSWWWSGAAPLVRVASANDPNHVLGELSLGQLPVVGATVRNGRLYLAQSQANGFYPLPLADGTDGSDPGSNAPNFFLTVIDVTALPALSVLGRSEATIDGTSGANWDAVWPREDVLVWSGGGFNFWWWDLRGGPIAVGGVAGGAAFWWPWWGGGGGQLLAFEVSDATQPKFASQTQLAKDSSWWSFSKPFTAEGLVYLSHNFSEFIATDPVDPVATDGGVLPVPVGIWMQKTFLDVIDYADAAHPTVREPVNLPGALNGIARQGSLLYTVGPHWNTNNDWSEWLDASAYDGVAAHLVDSLALPNTWPHPLLVAGESVFLGRSGYDYTTTNVGPHQLETWTLPDTGKFAQLGAVTLNSPAQSLIARGSLLAAQESDNTVDLFDATTAATLRLVGHGRPGGCLWFDLNNADGAVDRGLWLPLGVYGVEQIGVNRTPISPTGFEVQRQLNNNNPRTAPLPFTPVVPLLVR